MLPILKTNPEAVRQMRAVLKDSDRFWEIIELHVLTQIDKHLDVIEVWEDILRTSGNPLALPVIEYLRTVREEAHGKSH